MPETLPIRFIAIDDNPVDLMIIKEFSAAYPQLRHCGSFHAVGEALQALDEINPDLIFLDIELPGLSGIDLLRKIRNKVPIAVFITSHAEFALEGFELSAFDYILKPLTEERFAQNVRRIEEFWEMKQKANAYEVLFEQEMLIIKEGHTQIRLPQQDIIFLEAMQDYTKIVTGKKNYMTLTTLSAFLEKLPADRFLRVHRSYAVAKSRIKTLSAGKLVCDNYTIPIGKTYRSLLSNLNLLH
ncbi:response regulator transcription factor [Pseudoflavitalea sp. G-6-1-2]|uniref:LytR/AlgR family response regulator transcription factor n=1 Tax=Pseudoflavitalea sp. G-6-1-2 TaxID=2728841 RepID=UPI00146E7067|nr:LytTR family DNA-binding domain-containing protein [Pseudoflavitalea sp. G-6-1-2]NML23742.1 response regulator transcription factor [Pseudoflavitalea sp. G-6-1-2]